MTVNNVVIVKERVIVMALFNTSDWIPPKTFTQFMKQAEDYTNNPDTQVVNMSYEELWTDTTTPVFEIVRRGFLNGESFSTVMGAY